MLVAARRAALGWVRLARRGSATGGRRLATRAEEPADDLICGGAAGGPQDGGGDAAHVVDLLLALALRGPRLALRLLLGSPLLARGLLLGGLLRRGLLLGELRLLGLELCPLPLELGCGLVLLLLVQDLLVGALAVDGGAVLGHERCLARDHDGLGLLGGGGHQALRG